MLSKILDRLMKEKLLEEFQEASGQTEPVHNIL